MGVRVLACSSPVTLPTADLAVCWEGPARNACRDLRRLRGRLPAAPAPLAEDLLDIATTVYLADIGVARGANERWVRTLELTVPVREPRFWEEQKPLLSQLLYVLTRDSFRFDFVAREAAPPATGVLASGTHSDCISLLSGGLDSLAGAVLLLRTGRHPLFVSHESGNPTIGAAQTAVRAALEKLVPEAVTQAGTRLTAGCRGTAALPFPPPPQREPSQRSRSLLYMSLAVLAASGAGVREIYVFENGILTVAVPLVGSRVGGLSTRSTHPRVLALMGELCRRAGLACELLNPFLYQTKAELLRDVLRPVLAPADIQRTVSCWAAGRKTRQCGGCVACLVRRFAMLAAGLPDEAYMLDLLGEPQRYVGTDAYMNLVDLLTQCAEFLRHDDAAMLSRWPELLDLQSAAVSLPDVLAMYRRYAEEVRTVVARHFPATARLLQQVTG